MVSQLAPCHGVEGVPYNMPAEMCMRPCGASICFIYRDKFFEELSVPYGYPA